MYTTNIPKILKSDKLFLISIITKTELYYYSFSNWKDINLMTYYIVENSTGKILNGIYLDIFGITVIFK